MAKNETVVLVGGPTPSTAVVAPNCVAVAVDKGEGTGFYRDSGRRDEEGRRMFVRWL